MKICLIDSDASRLSALKSLLFDLPTIEFKQQDMSKESRLPQGPDAVFLTLVAAERWKQAPFAPQMQVLKVPVSDQAEGYPPFIITGRALKPSESRDSSSQVQIILEETLIAVQVHNQIDVRRMETVGFRVANLANGISLEELASLLRATLKNDASNT